eukprot:337047-Prorocentrum_minimum.AAC.1
MRHIGGAGGAAVVVLRLCNAHTLGVPHRRVTLLSRVGARAGGGGGRALRAAGMAGFPVPARRGGGGGGALRG